MTAIPIHTIDSAPAGSRETLRTVQQTLGAIPSLAAGMAESPTLLRAFFTVREIYAQGTLTPLEIQVLSLANAVENGCGWCVAFHTVLALKEGISAEALAALRAGRDPAEPKLGALSAFSRALIRSRGAVSDSDLDRFLTAGWTRAQMLEVVLGISFSTMANYAGHLIDAPLGPMLEPHEWTPSSGSPRVTATAR
jgi:AhpD family alkylhydroperoxidase